jgi:glycosyltransferase involved in cell wall biosynthesis
MGNVIDIEQIMQKAKALIIPSRSEGFGFCMVEAMFNGCLCLGLYSSGSKEQMENGIERTGHEIALPFTNTRELTTLLIKVHRCNDSVWDNMLKAAFETVNSLYTFDNTATAVMSIYKEIMKHRTTSKA